MPAQLLQQPTKKFKSNKQLQKCREWAIVSVTIKFSHFDMIENSLMNSMGAVRVVTFILGFERDIA